MKYLSLLLLLVTNMADAQRKIILSEKNVENAYPRLSHDAKTILYQSNKGGKWQLYTCDRSGKNVKRITNDQFDNNFPDWSADNKWIAFVSTRNGNEELYLMRADGTNLKRVTNNSSRDIHPYFSPDGKYLLFNSDREGNQFDVYRYTIETGKTERLTNTPDNETCARYSPDMKQIVLLRNSEVADDVYVLNTSDFLPVNISKTSNVNHGWPVFSPDGRHVYYSSMEGGTYSIYRVKPDGSGKQQLTTAKNGEEHARVNIASDNSFMIYNIRAGNAIAIVQEKIGS